MEQIPKLESAEKGNRGEEISHAAPAGPRTHDLPMASRLAVYHRVMSSPGLICRVVFKDRYHCIIGTLGHSLLP